MGRSPFFEYFIRPMHAGSDMTLYHQIKRGAFLKMSAYEDLSHQYGISRSCSCYGREEVYLPTDADLFTVSRKIKKKIWKMSEYDPWCRDVKDHHENIFLLRQIICKMPECLQLLIESYLCVEYKLIEVDTIDPLKMATFFVRSDGSILNIEDFSYRGKIITIKDVSDQYSKTQFS
jgi:hypothetical protein